MPPKKKKEKIVEELVSYSADVMNTLELKEYARMLERDIEAMRNCCNFYQKSGDKLGGYYRTRLVELKRMDDLILAKDVEMEKIRFKVEENIREKKDWAAYDEFTNEERRDRHESEASGRLEKGTEEHMIEQNVLRTKIEEKERELMAEGRKFQMTRNQALDKNAKEMEDMGEHEKNLLEKSVQAFVGMLEDTDRLNRLALNSLETETLEAKRRGEQEFRNSCTSYKERLHKYYKDITREDLDSIRKLTVKAEELEDSIKTKRTRLRCVQLENEQLKSSGNRPKGPPKYVPPSNDPHQRLMLTRKATNLKRIQQLRGENETLQTKITSLNEQTDNLRRQFTQVLYRVRQSADLKVAFLRKKLTQNQNPSAAEEGFSSSSTTDSHESEKNSDVSNADEEGFSSSSTTDSHELETNSDVSNADEEAKS